MATMLADDIYYLFLVAFSALAKEMEYGNVNYLRQSKKEIQQVIIKKLFIS